MMSNLIRGASSVGMRTIMSARPTLPLPDPVPTMEDEIARLQDRVREMQTILQGKVDRGKVRTEIAYSDEALLIKAQDIILAGDVTFAELANNWNGTESGLPLSITLIKGDHIRTGTIVSNNWGADAGMYIGLNDGHLVVGGSENPSLMYDGANMFMTGTLTANSIITGSIQIQGRDLTVNDLVDLAESAMTSADFTQMLGDQLDAGVGNITAGVGNDFLLEVEANSVFMRHKDFNQAGTGAYTGTLRTAMFQSANGIALGYNQRSNGAFVPAVTIESTGQVNVRGTITAGSVIAGSVTVSGTPIDTIRAEAEFGAAGIYNLTNTGGSTVLRGVIVPTDSGALRAGNITWNTTTGAVTGGTGTALTPFGLIGAASGITTFSLSAITGGALFGGDIETSGRILAYGNYLQGGISAAIHAIPTNTAATGLHARSINGDAIWSNPGINGVGLRIEKSDTFESTGLGLFVSALNNYIGGNLSLLGPSVNPYYEGNLILGDGFQGTRENGRAVIGARASSGATTLNIQTWADVVAGTGPLAGLSQIRIWWNNQQYWLPLVPV